jgi:hypothetical protein
VSASIGPGPGEDQAPPRVPHGEADHGRLRLCAQIGLHMILLAAVMWVKLHRAIAMNECLLVAVAHFKSAIPDSASSAGSASRPCTNPLRGIGVVCGTYPAPEPLTGEASKVVSLPQTPPGAERLDVNTDAHFR